MLRRTMMTAAAVALTVAGMVPAVATGEFSFTDDADHSTVTGCVGGASACPATLTIPSSHNGKPVTAVADSAFAGSTTITTAVIPTTVTSIGDGMFQDSINVGQVTFAAPSHVLTIGTFFVAGTKVTSMVIPPSVTSLGDGSFGWIADGSHASLTNVTFASPSALTSLGDYMFADAANLQSITFTGNAPTWAGTGVNAFSLVSNSMEVRYPSIATGWVAAIESAPLARFAHLALPTPAVVAVPKVTGKARKGRTLAASAGTWSGTPTTLAYQWFKCSTRDAASHAASTVATCTAIAGATTRTLKVKKSYKRKYLRVRVSASNVMGASFVFSPTTTKVK